MNSHPTATVSWHWLVWLGLALATHALLAINFSAHVWVTPLGSSLTLCVVLAYCVTRLGSVSGTLKLRWMLLAAGTGLWILGWAMSAYSQLTNADTTKVLPYLMVFALRAIPWLLAVVLTSNRKVLTHTRAFDLAQSALLTVAISLLYVPQIAGGATFTIPLLTGQHSYNYHELVNVLIAFIAVAFVPVQPTAAERRFSVGLAAMLSSYAASALIVNHLVIDVLAPPPGAPWFLLIDVAATVFLLHQVVMTKAESANGEHPSNALRNMLVLIVPALAPLAIILISIVLADYNALLAGLLACSALGLYVARSVLTQHAFQRVHRQLEAANSRMAWLAEQDELTGLANRRQLTRVMDMQWARHAAQERPVSLLFIDIDYFKLYNDTFGHAAGDECLIMVGKLLQEVSASFPDALVARYGGEEFVILLPATDSASANACAEQVRLAVMQAGISHMVAPSGMLSVSIGTSSAQPSFEDPHPFSLVENADAALYAAKQRGRNQVSSQVSSQGN